VDQLSAHLDRGWDLAQRGDTRGAESAARHAIQLSPESPEAHNLLGFVAAMDGDCDEAIEAYQQAILFDETYVEAMLNAAELLVHPMGQFEDAASMCDQVLDVTDFQDEIIEALLLKFEAVAAQGEADEAERLLKLLPEGPYENASHNYLAGRAHFELGDIENAERLIAAALEKNPRHADAHYYMGLLCEERSDRQGACASFLQTRQIELEMGLPPWSPNAEAFLMFTERAVRELGPELLAFAEFAEIYIADLPGPEVVVDGVDPRSIVLVDALLAGPDDPDTELAIVPEQISLRVFLYALNITRSASGLHSIQSTIRDAIKLELGATLDELRQELAEQLSAQLPDGSSDRPSAGPSDGPSDQQLVGELLLEELSPVQSPPEGPPRQEE
jgi:Flp pilus assembly protein TadD